MLHLGQEWDVSDMVSLQNAKSAHGHHPRNKENIEKLSVITAVCAPPNQHQINVNAWLTHWPEMDKLETHFDLSAAFDVLEHSNLLNKLEKLLRYISL